MFSGRSKCVMALGFPLPVFRCSIGLCTTSMRLSPRIAIVSLQLLSVNEFSIWLKSGQTALTGVNSQFRLHVLPTVPPTGRRAGNKVHWDSVSVNTKRPTAITEGLISSRFFTKITYPRVLCAAIFTRRMQHFLDLGCVFRRSVLCYGMSPSVFGSKCCIGTAKRS